MCRHSKLKLYIKVANSTHKYPVLWSSTFLLMVLNAFSASTSSIASALLSSNISCIAWIAASQPAACPVHNCKRPAALIMYFLTICITTFPAILRRTSPIHMGLKPGFLSYGISLQAKNTSRGVSLISEFSSIFLMQTFYMTSVKAFRRSMLTVP